MWIFVAAAFFLALYVFLPAFCAEERALATSRSATASHHLPPGTLELIRAQTLKARELALERGLSEAQNELHKVDNQIKSEQDKITRLENSLGGRGDQQAITPQELQEMRNRLSENIERLRQAGEARAAYKEQEAQAKAEDLQHQADALEKQILRARNQQDGELKLNPVGTNLYVRNYVDVRPPAKPLRATQKILPAVGSINKQTSAALRSQVNSAQLKVRGLKGTTTHTDVRGILIKP
jgi:hypothetical protein